MQSEIPSQSFIWGVLAARFQSELTLQKSEICRLSGLLGEYGPAGGNYTGEGEEHKIIEELTGFLVQAVARDAVSQQMPPRPSPSRCDDPLFGAGASFSIPALSQFGRPTVGSDFDRWQA